MLELRVSAWGLCFSVLRLSGELREFKLRGFELEVSLAYAGLQCLGFQALRLQGIRRRFQGLRLGVWGPWVEGLGSRRFRVGIGLVSVLVFKVWASGFQS